MKLLMNFLKAVLGNEAMRKDTLTSAAIMLCSLIQHSHPEPEAIACQLACIAGCEDLLDASGCMHHFESGKKPLVGAHGVLDACFLVHHAQMPEFSRQALFRGVLSAGSRQALTCHIRLKDGSAGQSLMFSLVYDKVCEQCAGTADLFLVCYGLQTLTYNVEIVRQALQDSLQAVNSCQEETRLPATSKVVGDMFEAGVRIIWPHCEDPFQGIADQTKDMFEKLIGMRELGEIIANYEARKLQPGSVYLHEGLTIEARKSIFSELLQMAVSTKPNRKARYRVMAALVPRIGTSSLLSTSSDFMGVMLGSMRDQSVGSCAAALLLAMLVHGKEDSCGDSWWLEPCLHALTHADAQLKHAMCNYALPTLARGLPGSIDTLLDALQASQPEGGGEVVTNLWAITAVIKISRRWGSDTDVQPANTQSSARFLRAALLHASDDMRLNALEMICINPKNAEPATVEELALVREFLTFNLKSSSSFYRQRCMELLKKLFIRLRVSRNNLQTKASKTKGKKQSTEVQQELISAASAYTVLVDSFLAWLTVSLTAALYPGGSYERNIMALELYAIVVDVWMPAVAPHPDTNLRGIADCDADDELAASHLFRPEAVCTIINAIVNSFDLVRRNAFDLIMRFPAPLAGITSKKDVAGLLRWADALVSSPRARESDAGSLIVQLIHAKYIRVLGWYLSPHAPNHLPPRAAPIEGESASLYFVKGLLENITRVADDACTDFEATFSSSFAQGALLCLR